MFCVCTICHFQRLRTQTLQNHFSLELSKTVCLSDNSSCDKLQLSTHSSFGLTAFSKNIIKLFLYWEMCLFSCSSFLEIMEPLFSHLGGRKEGNHLQADINPGKILLYRADVFESYESLEMGLEWKILCSLNYLQGLEYYATC